MAIVTLSGQVGSGAQDIGRETARLLGADFVDRELLAEAARRTGIGEKEWAAHDMRLPTLAERVAHLFQNFLQHSAMAYPSDPYMGGEPILSRTYEELAAESMTPEQHLSDKLFLDITTSIIKELAQTGNVVIIGRGAHYILKGHPRTFNVFTVAPVPFRAQLFAQREMISPAEAEAEVVEGEMHRQAFLHKFFHVDPTDVSLFDIVLKTDRLTFRQYAEMIASGAQSLDARVLGGA